MRSTFRSIALVLLLLGSLAGAYSASAATGSGSETSGFLTLTNPETGQQIAAWCRDGIMDSLAVVDDGESYVVETPIGTLCSPAVLPGFVPVINIDARDGGWVILPYEYGRQMAYACTNDGAAFAIGRPDAEFYVFLREGYCGPGATLG